MTPNLILIVTTAIGCLMIMWGVRGRLVARSANCRKCKYDLAAIQPVPSRCPECGRDLAKKRAVRPVQRQKRPVVIALGVLIFASSIIAQNRLAWYRANQSWIPKASTWALINLGLPLMPLEQDAEIYSEIVDRILAGSITDDTTRALSVSFIKQLGVFKDQGQLVDATFDFDGEYRWSDSHTNIIKLAISKNLLSLSQQRAYYVNGSELQFFTSSTQRSSDGASLSYEDHRAGGGTISPFYSPPAFFPPTPVINWSVTDLRIDGVLVNPIDVMTVRQGAASSELTFGIQLFHFDLFSGSSDPYVPSACAIPLYGIDTQSSGPRVITGVITFDSATLGTWSEPFQHTVMVVTLQTDHSTAQ